MTCIHCDGTGSLLKTLETPLDCGYCNVANERASLENWVRKNAPRCDYADAWLIFQHGRAAQAGQNA